MKRRNQVRRELEVLEGRWAASTLLDCAPTELGPRANSGEELAVTAEVAAAAKSARGVQRNITSHAATTSSAQQPAASAKEMRVTSRSVLAATLRQETNASADGFRARSAALANESQFASDESPFRTSRALASREILVSLPELSRAPSSNLSRTSFIADWTGSGGPSVAGPSLANFSVSVTIDNQAMMASAAQPVEASAGFSAPFVPEENAGGDKVTAAAKPSGGGTSTKTFAYWAANRRATDLVVPPANLDGGLALVGGSTDVDAVFSWMGERAGGGDFLVIRATGTDAYNSYIDRLTNLNSVATLLIGSRDVAMTNSSVVSYIDKAEAIFIAGGDQANYENFWANTPVEDALYRAIGRGVPLGGTSAGLAVLGEVDFTATQGTIASTEALTNPLDSRVTLSTRFLTPADPANVLNLLDNVITDSHFEQRDRMGRLLTFMARADYDRIPGVEGDPRAIAINEQTALLVEPSGHATVVGNASAGVTQAVYFLDATATSVPAIAVNQPLSYADVNVVRAGVGDSFNLANWTSGSLPYQLDVVNGTVVSTRPTIYG